MIRPFRHRNSEHSNHPLATVSLRSRALARSSTLLLEISTTLAITLVENQNRGSISRCNGHSCADDMLDDGRASHGMADDRFGSRAERLIRSKSRLHYLR
jgi:hypothetical protein